MGIDNFLNLLEKVSKIGAPLFITVWYFVKIEPKNQSTQQSLETVLRNLTEVTNKILISQKSNEKKMELLEKKIEKNRTWDIDSYCNQIINVFKLTTYNFRDYLYELIEKNSLYENKDDIADEIVLEAKTTFQKAIAGLESIPFDRNFDQQLQEILQVILKDTLDGILDTFNVRSKNYDPLELKRKVRNLAKEVETITEEELTKLKKSWKV